MTGLVVLTVVVAGAFLLVRDSGGDDTDAAVVTDGRTGPSTGVLPDGSVGDSEPLLDEAARERADAAAAAAGDDALEDVARRAVAGRVQVRGGGALPEGLAVYATSRRPYPRMGRFEDVVGERQGPSWYALPESLEREALEEQTRVAVDAEGRFAMDGVPVTGAFLGVDHERYYATEIHRVEADTGEVVVTVALGARVEGRVRDVAGRPVAGAELTGRSPFDPYAMFGSSSVMAEVENAETDADGRFVLGPLPPGVDLMVRAFDDEHAPARERVSRLAAGRTAEIELTMRPGAVVTGAVVDEDGAPVPDVAVLLMQTSFNMSEIDTSEDGNGRGGLERKRVTDEDGRFEYKAVPPAEYTLSLKSSDYRPSRTESFALDHGQLVEGLRITAERGLSIDGVVLDREGEPVEGARVLGSPPITATTWWNAQDAANHPEVTTDEAGRFAMAGYDPGDVELRVRREGFLPTKQRVAAGASGVVVELERNGLVSGIVVSLVDSEPVTAFEVELMPAGGLFDMTDMMNIDQRFQRMVPARSFESETGEFEIEDVMSGDYDATIRAEGFGTVVVEGITVAPGRPTKGVVVMMPAEGVVSGLVLDDATNAPVEGVTVTLGGAGMFEQMTAQFAGTARKAHTDADGRFVLDGLHEGRIDLTLRDDHHVDLTVPDIELLSGQSVDLGVLRLSVGGVIHGTVYDEADRFVPKVPVLVSEAMGRTIRRTETDERGAYRAQGLPAGTYNVMRLDFDMSFDMESAADFMNDLNFEVVQLSADEEREIDLRVKGDGAVLKGVVRDADGAPAAAMITLTPDTAGAAGVEFSSSDSKGNYELTGLAPGRYTLNAIPVDGMGVAASGQPQSGAIESITITTEPEQRHDVRLSGGTLEVRVVARRGGQPLPGVRVVLERRDDERPSIFMMELIGWRVGEAYSDAEGVARFRYLDTGTYEVVAGGKNIMGMGLGGWATARVGDVRVVEGDPGFPVRVELDEAGVLSGLVTDAKGRALAGASVWARGPDGTWQSVFAEVQTDAAGRFTLDSVSEGMWDVAVRDDSHALLVREAVNVRRGETREVELRLERGVGVQAQLVGVDLARLDFEITGPYGRVPTELVSLSDLMSSMTVEGRIDLGRLLPGAYEVLVVEDGARVLLSETVDLGAAGDPHLLVLGP